MEGNHTQALREFEALQDKRDLILAIPTALIYAHERCRPVDKEAVEELQAKLTIMAASANIPERAHVSVALFLWHIGKSDPAKEYLLQACRDTNALNAQTYLACIELKKSRDVKKIARDFDAILFKNPNSIEVYTL